MSRRRGIGPWLLLAFVIIPIVEIFVLIQVGQVIGAWWAVTLLLVDSLIGAWLVRREGSRAFVALRSALNEGRMPGAELADGALILFGGALMLTPGFVTDALAVLFLLPLTRPLFRSALTRAVSARLRVMPGTPGGFPPPSGDGKSPGSTDPTVVRGEVVDDD